MTAQLDVQCVRSWGSQKKKLRKKPAGIAPAICVHDNARSIEKTALGDMSPTVDSTGSSLGDLIYSVHGLLDESSYDREGYTGTRFLRS